MVIFSKWKKALVRRIFNKLHEQSTEPWATFEVQSFSDDGQMKIEFNWNKAFIQKIHSLGFHAETEQDSVQLFFYTSQMRPTSLAHVSDDDGIAPSDHPQLRT